MSLPKCGHKPDPGFRELFGEEREAHIAAMEKAVYVTRRRRTGKLRPDLKNTCLHIYVKI